MCANSFLRDKMVHVRTSDTKTALGLGLTDGAFAALFNRAKVVGVMSLLEVQNTIFGDSISKALFIKLLLVGPIKKKK